MTKGRVAVGKIESWLVVFGRRGGGSGRFRLPGRVVPDLVKIQQLLWILVA